MIAIIDDESLVLDVFEELLAAKGFSVTTFSDARQALVHFESMEPELVLCDVKMPNMDGFELQKAYFHKFPTRMTPFIFLSCADDPETIIRGLEQGAADFIPKSTDPSVLIAKLRAHIKRHERYTHHSFHGDLSVLPFHKVLQFCEVQGFTGCMHITHPDFQTKIPFKGGKITDHCLMETIERLLDQPKGSFSLLAEPIVYDGLTNGIELPRTELTKSPIAATDKPLGKLSGVKVNNRFFQIQTEFNTSPDRHIQTIVVFDGQIMTTKRTSLDIRTSFHDIELMVEKQHLEMEAELKNKLARRLAEKSDQKSEAKHDFYSLVERGHERYLQKDLSTALTFWEKALQLRPDDTVLKVNIAVAKRKMAQ